MTSTSNDNHLDIFKNLSDSLSPHTAKDVFVCEGCQRQAGRDLLACPRRKSGDCGYHVYQHDTRLNKPGYVLTFLLTGVSILLMLILVKGIADSLTGELETKYQTLLCLIPAMLLLSWLLYRILPGQFRGREAIVNPEAGHLWQRETTLFKRETRRTLITGKQHIYIKLPELEPLTLPVSVSALNPEWITRKALSRSDIPDIIELNVFILTTTFLNLIEQKHLNLWHGFVYQGKGAQLKPVIDGPEYVLTPGGNSDIDSLQGDLEKTILRVVQQADPYQVDGGKPLTIAHALKGWPIDDLVVQIFIPHVAYHINIPVQVLNNAADLGLARRKTFRRGWATAFDKEGLKTITRNYEILNQVYKLYGADHLEILYALENQCRKGVLRRKTLRGEWPL